MKDPTLGTSKDYLERWNDATYVHDFIQFTEKRNEDSEEWTRQLKVDETSTVVDLGCGEARILAAMAPNIDRGIGIEASVHMLAAARNRLANLDIKNVELVRADLRNFDTCVEASDAVMSRAALHHVNDRDKQAVFHKIFRVLRPGGIFSLQDDSFNFPREEFETRIPQIISEWESAFGPAGWKFMKEKLAGDDFENTSFLDDLKRMIESCGFKLLSVVPSGLNGSRITGQKPV